MSQSPAIVGLQSKFRYVIWAGTFPSALSSWRSIFKVLIGELLKCPEPPSRVFALGSLWCVLLVGCYTRYPAFCLAFEINQLHLFWMNMNVCHIRNPGLIYLLQSKVSLILWSKMHVPSNSRWIKLLTNAGSFLSSYFKPNASHDAKILQQPRVSKENKFYLFCRDNTNWSVLVVKRVKFNHPGAGFNLCRLKRARGWAWNSIWAGQVCMLRYKGLDESET